MFRKVEINIPLLDTIMQIPKYAKFLKELCVHKRKRMKGSMEMGGIMLVLTKNEDFTTGAQALPKKCRDLRIFFVPCTIGGCTFANAMLDLGASINIMPMSIYKSLKFGDLELTRMIIQLANRSVVQPLGVLEDVLIQVNELIFPTDFYVLDMEDETSRKRSTLILGRPFLMTARIKIDVYVGMLLMEFGDTLVQFNIVKADLHEHVQAEIISAKEDQQQAETESILAKQDKNYVPFGSDFSATQGADSTSKLTRVNSTQAKRSQSQQAKAEIMSAHLSNLEVFVDNSSFFPPPMELKPLPGHLKYAYLDAE
ncbi:hypothetical protein CR513_04637, partial [Mucuna pruriens]